jgi:hypothetical protein
MASLDTWEARGPVDPKKVIEIVRLRDQKNMRWRQIGAHMGMSHQGPYLLYKRWHKWAYKRPLSEMTLQEVRFIYRDED